MAVGFAAFCLRALRVDTESGLLGLLATKDPCFWISRGEVVFLSVCL
jgi:hypothetical protein